MIQGVGFSPIRNTAPVNTKFLPAPQTNPGNDFRDVLSTKGPNNTIFTALTSGSQRDKLIDAINQARVFTPPTFIAQPATDMPQKPEQENSISIVSKQEVQDEQNRKLKEASGIYESSYENYFNGLQAENTGITK